MNGTAHTINTDLPKPEDPVNHPSHYTGGPSLGTLECLDITRILPFDLGNAFKYVWRAGKKNPEKAVEDLKKAEFYLNDWWKMTKMLQVAVYPKEAFLLAYTLFKRIENAPMNDWLEKTRFYALEAIIREQTYEANELILRMESMFNDRA